MYCHNFTITQHSNFSLDGNNCCVISSYLRGDIEVNQPIVKPNKLKIIIRVWTLDILISKHFVNDFNIILCNILL